MPLDTTGGNKARNVLGGPLEICSIDPLTGFSRSGSCETGPGDVGSHCVCAIMTGPFLSFSEAVGNDLTTPRPSIGFPGLKPGDRWCLCSIRWAEAFAARCAPEVILEATHENALEWCALKDLQAYANDGCG